MLDIMTTDLTAGVVAALIPSVATLVIFVLRRSGHEPKFIRALQDRLERDSSHRTGPLSVWRKAVVGNKVDLQF